MSPPARARLVCSAAAALFVVALAGGCGSSPPTDKNFGTDLGADFKAPITDAGSVGDTNVTPEASVDGTGAGDSGGTTGAGGTTSGSGGQGGTAGADAAAGKAGAAGAGS